MPPSQPPEDVKERLKASYDAIAPTYNNWTTAHSPLRLAYLEKLIEACPKLLSASESPTILELGCGSGNPFLTTILSKSPNLHATANDLSDTQLDLARSHLSKYEGRVTFIPGDMTKLTFPPSSLTAVTALYSIIHLAREEQTSLINEITNWLEPGGYLLANFSVENTEGIVMEKWLDDKGWMFWSGWGEEGTIKVLKEAGLDVESKVLEAEGVKEMFVWIIAKKPAV